MCPCDSHLRSQPRLCLISRVVSSYCLVDEISKSLLVARVGEVLQVASSFVLPQLASTNHCIAQPHDASLCLARLMLGFSNFDSVLWSGLQEFLLFFVIEWWDGSGRVFNWLAGLFKHSFHAARSDQH